MASSAHPARLSPYFRATRGDHADQRAFQLLYGAYILVPIIAGFDKFADSLANWPMYLAPVVRDAVPLPPDTLMRLVGTAEIAAGLLVVIRPRLGATVVAIWLGLVIANLAALGHYWDVALRDAGLLLGALALARSSPRRSPRAPS